MQDTTDARLGGVFRKRFWTEPRPRTGASRAELVRRLWAGLCELAIFLIVGNLFIFAAATIIGLVPGGPSSLFP